MNHPIPPQEFATELVRGNVKAAMSAASAKSADLWQVPPAQIRVLPGFNVREDSPDYRAHIGQLKESIKLNGYYQDKPLTGFVSKEAAGNIIYLTDGHSRFAAIQEAISEGMEFDRLPVIVKPQGTSMEDMTIALATGNSGRPLTPYELGIVCKRLQGGGMDVQTIAQRLVVSRTYVDTLLELVAAPKPVRDMVIGGSVSAGTAVKALRQHGTGAAAVLKDELDKAAAEGKTKVTPRAMAKRAPGAKPEAKVAERLALIARELATAWRDLDDATRKSAEALAILAPLLDKLEAQQEKP